MIHLILNQVSHVFKHMLIKMKYIAILVLLILSTVTFFKVQYDTRYYDVDISQYVSGGGGFIEDVSHYPNFGQGGVKILIYELNADASLNLSSYRKKHSVVDGEIAGKLSSYFDLADPVNQYAVENEYTLIQKNKYLAFIKFVD